MHSNMLQFPAIRFCSNSILTCLRPTVCSALFMLIKKLRHCTFKGKGCQGPEHSDLRMNRALTTIAGFIQDLNKWQTVHRASVACISS